MKRYTHRYKGLKRKAYTGRSHTRKGRDANKKKSRSLKKQTDQNVLSNPTKTTRIRYRYDPWWLPANYLLKTRSMPSSVPIFIGTGDTVKKKGGADQ